MRIAIIGGGSIGQRHVANARALGHDVVVFDVDQSRGRSLITFTGAGLLLASDAVMICAPAHAHAWLAVNLLELNYQGPLFIEKPVATVSDVPVFTVWPHPTTMVGYNWRFHPHLQFLKSQSIRSFGAACHTDMRTWPGSHYADPLLECSHELDLAMAHLGPVLTVRDSFPFEDGHGLHLQHERGESHLVVRWATKPWRHVSVELTDGTVVDVEPSIAPDAEGLAESYRAELRHFLACVQAGTPTDIPFEQGLRVVELCERVRVKELAQ